MSLKIGASAIARVFAPTFYRFIAMFVCPLFSGSSGNATYVSSGSTRILVDCGGSCRAVERELQKLDVTLDSIDCILVTHAHSDHVKGLEIVSKRYHIPIYGSIGTWQELMRSYKIPSVKKENIRVFRTSGAQKTLDLGDLQATFFSTPHDALDSVGYVLDDGAAKFGFATDLGRVSPGVRQNLTGCDVVLLEANYDLKMLQNGPYPYPLKERIRGAYGHLSNDDSGKFAADLVQSGVKTLYLGHLSEHNNTIDLAYRTVCAQMQTEGVNPKSDCQIFMTRRHEASRALTF